MKVRVLHCPPEQRDYTKLSMSRIGSALTLWASNSTTLGGGTPEQTEHRILNLGVA